MLLLLLCYVTLLVFSSFCFSLAADMRQTQHKMRDMIKGSVWCRGVSSVVRLELWSVGDGTWKDSESVFTAIIRSLTIVQISLTMRIEWEIKTLFTWNYFRLWCRSSCYAIFIKIKLYFSLKKKTHPHACMHILPHTRTPAWFFSFRMSTFPLQWLWGVSQHSIISPLFAKEAWCDKRKSNTQNIFGQIVQIFEQAPRLYLSLLNQWSCSHV